jgi:hypothetical protein
MPPCSISSSSHSRYGDEDEAEPERLVLGKEITDSSQLPFRVGLLFKGKEADDTKKE